MVRVLLILLALGLAGSVAAQTAVNPPQPAAKPAPKAAKPASQAAKKSPSRPTWAELTAQQQEVLAQLKPEWDRLDRDRRLKWLGIAKRYPTMSAQQQERVQRRMQAWVKLTPEQRRLARENYKNMAKAPADRRGDLREQWAEYQALTPAERQGLTPPAAEAHKHRY